MGRKFQIKRGNEADIPILAPGEMGFTLDSKKLFVGTGSQNVPINSSALQEDANGNMNLKGNLTLKGSGNYGTKINFGDGDYVHISEPADDTLEIKGTRIKMLSGSTEVVKIEGGKAYINGAEVNTAGLSPDFDTLLNCKGYRCETVKTSSGFTETLTNTATAKKAAVRTTTKLSNGFQEVCTFYKEDGTTVKETRTKTTTKTTSGFSEVIA